MFDVVAGRFVDPARADFLDSAKAVRTSLRLAGEMVGLLLTADNVDGLREELRTLAAGYA